MAASSSIKRASQAQNFNSNRILDVNARIGHGSSLSPKLPQSILAGRKAIWVHVCVGLASFTSPISKIVPPLTSSVHNATVDATSTTSWQPVSPVTEGSAGIIAARSESGSSPGGARVNASLVSHGGGVVGHRSQWKKLALPDTDPSQTQPHSPVSHTSSEPQEPYQCLEYLAEGSTQSLIDQPRRYPQDALELSSSGTFTAREAKLLRLWIEKISLISNVFDDGYHFSVVVPRLAIEHPMIRHGVLAITSRHDAITRGTEDLESVHYHNKCIEHLIKALANPEEKYDCILLVAVVISRFYEENDAETSEKTFHLRGARTLLSNNIMSRIAKERSLAEAACWLYLRQAIYSSVVHKKHCDVPLSIFETLSDFSQTNDSSLANRVVLIFAHFLQLYFPAANENQEIQQQQDQWETLTTTLDAWHAALPRSFEPLRYQPAEPGCGRPLPTIWMLSSVQDCNESAIRTGFEAAKVRRFNEKLIATYLCALMGLATSNEGAFNAWYLPCHMLELCGYLLRSPIDREKTLEFLVQVPCKIQWKTSALVRTLKDQWKGLDGYG
ncbi:hypothetical protein QQS21_008786 [Conoideocrella luteorostrata]|uniref:ARCA-like protein n=1 Tax=Conoideocrella luteorostrata TaxID=1105319 RepID=A0AAJ0FYE1_9HYPO|nr:hypothetical protein QQS21_008786 [Conoideocrella luteorostrata]